MIKRKTRNFEKLIKKLKKLDDAKVKSGYFPEQGIHSSSGIPYYELAFIHAKGEGNFPRRDVRPSVLTALWQPEFKRTAVVNTMAYLNGKVPLESLLDTLGFKITDIAQSYFGIPSKYNPSNSDWWASQKKEGDTPLVFDGELRDMWSYKTSENNTPRTIV